jgi:hypothetical protein
LGLSKGNNASIAARIRTGSGGLRAGVERRHPHVLERLIPPAAQAPSASATARGGRRARARQSLLTRSAKPLLLFKMAKIASDRIEDCGNIAAWKDRGSVPSYDTVAAAVAD